jgi:hypothetical protein
MLPDLRLSPGREPQTARGACLRRRDRGCQSSYRERRKQLLLALLDQYTDDVDRAAEEIGTVFDRLRQVGIRGLVAEGLNDGIYVGLSPLPEDRAETTNADKDRRQKRRPGQG